MRPHIIHLAWLVPLLGFTACGDDTTAPGRILELAVTAGNHQPGRAGYELPDPFVVRVTQPLGWGVEGVTVLWTVKPGEGAFDGQFEAAEPECPALPMASTVTDADGYARMTFMPTRFGSITASAIVRGAAGSPALFTTDASDPGALITAVNEEHHEARAGDTLSSPLQVKVLDGDGHTVPNISVTWTTDPTLGSFLDGCPRTASGDRATTTVRTPPGGSSAGLSSMGFRPTDATTVSAAVPGVAGSPVSFTVEVTGLLISLYHDGWWGEIFFQAPTFTVPTGTPVEFRNDVLSTVIGSARIVSTSTPPGGEAFDSGELTTGERFTFVPGVAGTWQFVDEVSGATGELTSW